MTNGLLEYIGKKGESVQYYIDYPIPKDVNFSFFVKMLRITGDICVGLIDINKQKQSRSSVKDGFAVSYINRFQKTKHEIYQV